MPFVSPTLEKAAKVKASRSRGKTGKRFKRPPPEKTFGKRSTEKVCQGQTKTGRSNCRVKTLFLIFVKETKGLNESWTVPHWIRPFMRDI